MDLMRNMALKLGSYFPGIALKLMRAKMRYELTKRLYEAANLSDQHRRPKSTRTADGVMQHAGYKLTQQARYLDENHDLAIGILNDFENKVLGENGITITPAVQTKGGKPAKRLNKEIALLWEEHKDTLDISGVTFEKSQRLALRSKLRDGEIFCQHLEGVDNGGAVPYTYTLIESEHVPFDYTDEKSNTVHGITKDQYGRPTYFHFYEKKNDFLSLFTSLIDYSKKTKAIPASEITHLKHTKRVNQTRGVSIFHGVFTRLEDIKDYEESERIAARIAASFTAFIKRNPDFAGEAAAAAGNRSLEMESGMIFDNLLPGEDVGTIGTDRPNTNLESYRNGQLRAVAAGTGTSFSSIAKDYRGTYSSQRQELVEAIPDYGKERKEFIDQHLKQVWRRFIDWLILTQQIKITNNINMKTITRADYNAPVMRSIDPARESKADKIYLEMNIKSRQQLTREKGLDPDMMAEQIEQDPLNQEKETEQPPTKKQADKNDQENTDEDIAA